MADPFDTALYGPHQRTAHLPRRTAHALHALLVATAEHVSPVTAREVCIYDEEALNPQSTAQALRAGARRGLCFLVPAGGGAPACWWATNELYEMRVALEERYLSETGDEEKCAFCNEWKPKAEFQDGLRCDECREEQDA